MTMNRNLGYFQIGKETAHGDAAAATEIIAVEDDIQFADDDNLLLRPNLRRGTLSRYPGNETIIKRGTRFTIPDTPMNFEQMRHILAMTMVSGVVASALGGGRYSRTYERSLTSIADIDTYCFERRASDGTNFKDIRIPYCFITKLTLKGAIDTPVTYSVDVVGRAPLAGPITAALALPTIAIPSSFLSALYIDSTWAGRGGTLISDQILGWQIDIYPGWYPFTALQGRTALDFATHKLNPDNLGIDVTVTALVGAQYDAERTAARAGTSRFVQMKVTDATGTDESLALNMALKHSASDILAFGNDNGQNTVDFKLVDSADNGAHFLESILINRAA
jgi:hypothetical protein